MNFAGMQRFRFAGKRRNKNRPMGNCRFLAIAGSRVRKGRFSPYSSNDVDSEIGRAEYLRGLAVRIAEPYIAFPETYAVLLNASASDLTLVIFYEELPPAGNLHDAHGPLERKRTVGDPSELHFLEEYVFENVELRLLHIALEACECWLQGTKNAPQIGFPGILEGIPLHGEWLIADFRDRVEKALLKKRVVVR